MDANSKKFLESILAKHKGSLNEDEVGFLRARSSYLNDEQLVRFADVLNAPVAQAEFGDGEQTSEPVEEEKPKVKSKKK